MIPGNSLSSTPEISPYIDPYDRDIKDYLHFFLGTSTELQSNLPWTSVWTLEIIYPYTYGSYVQLIGPTGAVRNVLTLPYLLFCRGAFDQNMHLTVAYSTPSGGFFYWYDSTIPGYSTLLLPSGVINPSCTLDIPGMQQTASGLNDIILTYVNNNNLCFRQTRDRYTIEYVLKTSVSPNNTPTFVWQVGMGTGNRLIFTLANPFF